MVRVSSSGVGRVESGSGGRGNARRAALWADTGGECVRERVCMQRRGQFVTQVTTVAPKGLTRHLQYHRRFYATR